MASSRSAKAYCSSAVALPIHECVASGATSLLTLASSAEVSEEQARAVHTYGSVIDHPSLCAWARALEATVMFWTDRPRRAATLAATALETSPVGTARARLHSVHARSLALIGARQEVRAALDAAADELQGAGDDPFLDQLGGELGFDRFLPRAVGRGIVCRSERRRAILPIMAHRRVVGAYSSRRQ